MFLAWCFDAPAQTPANGWLIENIHGPSQVGIVDTIPVDINQDGLMDVVSASIEDGHLRAYINQGNYEFEQQYISKEVPGIYRVSATDINQDGLTDFLLPSIETHEIIVLIAENEGYRKQIIASDVILPTDAQAGDFDNDGLMDVISISFEHHELILHLQQTDGTFHSQVISFSAQRPRKLQVADFNNDNLPDILVASSEDHSVRLFSNEGQATFDEHLISNQMTGTRFVASCDFNNDTLMDFAVSATGDDTVYLFANIGDEKFVPKPIDDNIPGVNATHCADIDQDQQTELISIASTIGNIYTHDLNGNFNRTLIANTRDGYVSVNSANFKPNDEPKILTQAYYENRNLLYKPNTTNQEQVVWEDFPEGVSKVVSADLNNDGVEDIVATSFRDDRVQFYNGVNNNHTVIAENIDGASDLVVGDFNGDGLLDVLTAAAFDKKFYLHSNLDGVDFKTTPIVDDAMFANALTVFDIDQDGYLDVLGTSASDDKIWWFKFTENDIIISLLDDSGDAPNDIEIGDLDSDGDFDFVVANYFSGDVVFFENNSFNVFNKQVISTGWSRPFSLLLRENFSFDYLNVIVSMSADNQVIELVQDSYHDFENTLLLNGVMNPRKLVLSNEKELYITSPDSQNILNLNNKIQSEPIVEHYFGVSDVNHTPIPNILISGSIEMNVVLTHIKDLIFKTSLEKE